MSVDQSDYRTAAMLSGAAAIAITGLVLGWTARAFFMADIDHIQAGNIESQAVSLGYGEYIDHGTGYWTHYRTFHWKTAHDRP